MSNYDLYSPIAIQAANTYGVPPQLFLWQIGQESGWNPSITSDQGAHLGLGQFDINTAAAFGLYDRTNPNASLDAAAKYDAQLYARYGNWTDALTHYGTIGPNVPDSVNQTAAGIIAGLPTQGAGKCVTPLFPQGSPFQGAVEWLGIQGKGDPYCDQNTSIVGGTQDPNAPSYGWLDSIIADLKAAVAPSVIVIVGLIFLAGGLYLFGSSGGIVKVKEAIS